MRAGRGENPSIALLMTSAKTSAIIATGENPNARLGMPISSRASVVLCCFLHSKGLQSASSWQSLCHSGKCSFWFLPGRKLDQNGWYVYGENDHGAASPLHMNELFSESKCLSPVCKSNKVSFGIELAQLAIEYCDRFVTVFAK